MFSRRPIRFTLTLWYAVTLAVILVFFSSFLYLTFSRELYLEADRDLLAIAESIASPMLEPFHHTSPAGFEQALHDFLGAKFNGKSVQVLDAAGVVIAQSKNLAEFRFRISAEAVEAARNGNIYYETVEDPQGIPYRIITYPVSKHDRLQHIVQVGASLRAADWMLKKILIVLGISIPLSLLLFSYGGWFLAGLALKPVDLITKSVKKITAANLSHRLEVVNSHDEIGQLVETFNDTLARLENSFNKTRQFSADVSHELRTPLTILRGETEVALRWAKEPEEFRAILQSNLEEIKRMSEIIEYLLDLAKAEERRLELNIQDVDLTQLLFGLVQQTSMLAHEKGVKVDLEGKQKVMVRGDELRLRQIFLNLLDNAVKYTPSGGVVKVLLDVYGGKARVSVIDNGIGIPEEDLPHIFDRFYRVDKARNRAQGGTGLGLSLTKSLVEAHGGQIEVFSQPDRGSTFKILLPAA